ncbi:MAG: Gldg family protein [Alphaproteobacteria bacterium]|nr:Gldg family protein [Alphaproteobacteria bacterium]
MIRWILDKKGGWLLLSAVAVLLFLAVNLAVAPLSGMRADLTADRLHTLSPGTRNILQKLPEPVDLTLYYSDTLGAEAPVYGNYASRVKDLLRVFENASNGKLTFTIKDPKPFSETEDKAVELGMQGIPLDDTGEKAYFGLAASSGKNKDSISFLQIERENFLEYDVASMISGLKSTGKPVLAVYTARPMFGDLQMQMRGIPTKPWAVVEQLKGQFDVRQIYTIQDVWKEQPSVLMVVHPGELDNEDYYNLDQYLLRGGKAMIFVDPFNETAAMRRLGAFPERVSSDLTKLLDHWGVEVVKDRVVADRTYARMVNAGDQNRIIPAPYLTWLTVKRDGFAGDDAVTSQINQMNVQSIGIIRPKPDMKLKLEPLITSTEDSQEVDVALINGQRPQILKMIEDFKPAGKPLIVAARLSGRSTTMFPDGPPKPDEPKEEGEDATPKKDEEKSGDSSDSSEPGDKSSDTEKSGDGAKAASDAPAETPAAPAAEKDTPAAVEKDALKDPKTPVVKADRAERDKPAAKTRAVAQAESGDTKPQATPAPAGTETPETETKPDAEKAASPETPAEPKQEPKAAEQPAKADSESAAAKSEEKKEPEEVKTPPFIAESTAPMNVILVADADLLEDRAWVQTREFFGQQVQIPFANNADFVSNAIENLAGGDDLISLRSRGTAQRPFNKIDELRLAANREYRAEERQLQKKLQEAEKKLAELETKKKEGGSQAAVDKAVAATAEKFTQEILSTRKALRNVQLALREDIESLESWLRFVNIALIPILVGIAAVVLGIVRMRRRKHTVESPLS